MLKFRGQSYSGSSLRTHPPYTRVARIVSAHIHLIGSGESPPARTRTTPPARPGRPGGPIDGVDPGPAVAVLADGDVFVRQLSVVINSVLKSARGIRWDYSG